jgi:hypothetical protein
MLNIRCEMVVQYEMNKLGFQCTTIAQGRVEVLGLISPEQIQTIRKTLLLFGLELIDIRKDILIEKIKCIIIELVHHTNYALKTNFSCHLTSRLNLDYTYLANTFSKDQGVTIEQFIIRHKVQRVKDLITCNELSLTEISWKMHYSSVAHLSAQFKKVTGVTPSHFKHQEHIN